MGMCQVGDLTRERALVSSLEKACYRLKGSSRNPISLIRTSGDHHDDAKGNFEKHHQEETRDGIELGNRSVPAPDPGLLDSL